jgi:DNA-binding response OmpR family regulator
VRRVTERTLSLDVAVLRWPADAARRDELVHRGRARLMVVAAGELPPTAPDGLEDWIRAGADPVEVFVRKERLRRLQAVREPARLDDDGLLRRGPHWVALTRREVPAATRLLAQPGALVARAELLRASYPGVARDERRLLDTLMRRFHRRIVPLGLAVHCVRTAGFLLEVGEIPV